MTDGLADLTARRERRVRSAPSPRHPKDSRSTGNPDWQVETTEPEAPALELRVSTATPLPSPEAQADVELRPKFVDQPAPLRAVQTYMTEAEIDLLRSARAAGLMRRADVTNSAVVRLALHELFDRFGPDGVVEKIASTAEGTSRRGRPRR